MEAINFKDSIERQIMQGVETAFIDKSYKSNENVQPKFVYNSLDKDAPQNVLNHLHNELAKCNEFWISVAFVTEGGLAMLKQQLREASQRNVKGRILTTRYLTFNAPAAFEELLKLKNVEVRVLEEDCHTKGYRFYYGEYGNLIIGSANLSAAALKSTEEWNIKLSSHEQGAMLDSVDAQFEKLWGKATLLTPEWIEWYKSFYEDNRAIIKKAKVTPMELATLQPNLMQREAMASLASLRNDDAKRALLISATGTGKTYLSAFDVRAYKPKRMLFLAHREQLLTQAKSSYQKVLADTVSFGIVSGSKKEGDADYVFSTVQTLSKDENLMRFAKDEFDYIIIDEVHRAGAATYGKVLEYFTPKFMMGMTATPERGDNVDIYQLFDYNIAYEIRLQQALEMNLLCPFHYYAIEDIIVEDEVIEDKEAFNRLTVKSRAKHILDEVKYYQSSKGRVKGLVFCSNVGEAKALANEFNALGEPSMALCGAHSQEERLAAIERLESDDIEDKLHYIFTVDIFNEGVDIPAVNQVVMIRPTESAIVFVQQLGRGLRKHDDKDYVVILDFIGNCDKSFLIPIALSGDRTYNKDNLRRFVSEDSKFLPGISTINFSKVTKEKIFASIDSAKLSSVRLLKEAYIELKKKLGRIPRIIDFEKYGTMDIQNFFNNDNVGNSYYGFLKKYEKEFTAVFNKNQELMMKYVSLNISQGKRNEDLLVLKELIQTGKGHLIADKLVIENVYRVLSNQFNMNVIITKGLEGSELVEMVKLNDNEAEYLPTINFEQALKDDIFRMMFEELVDYGLRQYEQNYSNKYKDTDFVLNKKYTYQEVCKLLGWEKNIPSLNIGGYKYDEYTNTMPVFINYNKAEDIRESIDYEDEFINQSEFKAFSKGNRRMNSPDMIRLDKHDENGMKVYLFVRKNKDDSTSKEFYFLGEIRPAKFEPTKLKNGTDAVIIHYELDAPVRPDLYEYITGV